MLLLTTFYREIVLFFFLTPLQLVYSCSLQIFYIENEFKIWTIMKYQMAYKIIFTQVKSCLYINESVKITVTGDFFFFSTMSTFTFDTSSTLKGNTWNKVLLKTDYFHHSL